MQGYFLDNGHRLSRSRLYHHPNLPDVHEFDWLVVMGGPMGVYDEDQYPWLTEEIQFIRAAIDNGKIVLGICLGAQLIAASLGAPVSQNEEREIGWFPVTATPEAAGTVLAASLQVPTAVFHWHGDTFELPSGATWLAWSEACRHQAFSIGSTVLGLQFHLEMTSATAAALLDNCGQGLEETQFVQGPDEIIATEDKFNRINGMMAAVLDGIVRANG